LISTRTASPRDADMAPTPKFSPCTRITTSPAVVVVSGVMDVIVGGA